METLPEANARLTWTPRRVGLALAASLGVHGVLVAALLLAEESPAHADHSGTTEVALRYAAVPVAAGNPGTHRHHVVSTDAPAIATAAPNSPLASNAMTPTALVSTPANAAETTTPSSTTTSAPTTAAGPAATTASTAPGADALRRDYLLRLGQRLAQELRYPPDARARGAQGRAQVHLHIARDGRVLSTVVTRGSGDSALDAGALDTVRRASPLPPFPPGLPDAALDVELPLSFRLDARTLP